MLQNLTLLIIFGELILLNAPDMLQQQQKCKKYIYIQ